MPAFFLKQRVRPAGLLLGVLLCACSANPLPPEQTRPVLQPTDPLPPPADPRPPLPPGPPLPEPRMDIRQALLTPGGVPGDFDGNGTVDLLQVTHAEDRAPRLFLFRGRGDGTFGPAETQATPERWNPEAVGDLDGDGDLDFIGKPGVRTFLNDGTGRFERGPVLDMTVPEAPFFPYFTTLADVDRDGALDVLSVQRYWFRADDYSRLTVWRTAGTGTLSVRQDFPLRSHGSRVATADLTGDGYPEFLVTRNESELLRVIDAKGFSGAPASVQDVLDPGMGCSGLTLILEDLDGDGDTDVATPCEVGLQFLLNDGRGNLTKGPAFGTKMPIHKTVAADLNADGRFDLVSGNSQPLIHLGQGGGSFRYQSSWATFLHGTPGYSTPEVLDFFLVDIDRDGHLDLLQTFSNYATGGGYYGVLMPGDGRGGFRGPEVRLQDTMRYASAFGDINGDGAEDLIAHGAVFINGPAGTFQQRLWEFDAGPPLQTVDVNDDGFVDVIGRDRVILSNGRTLEAPFQVRGASGTTFTGRHDVDHDGTLDLVFGDTFARGLGQGRFESTLPFPSAPDTFIKGPTLFADFNGDGALDVHVGGFEVLVCSDGSCQRRPQGPGVCLWNAEARRYESPVGSTSFTPLAASDVTGDGVVDLLSAEQLARGLGTGRFADAEPLPALSLVRQARLGVRKDLLLGDVDADGRTDVLRFREPFWVDLMRGVEDGELAPEVVIFAPGFHPDSRLSDVDDDGLPELLHTGGYGFGMLKLTTR